MKVRMYIDLWPGCDPSRVSIYATNTPVGMKPENCKRIAFDVVIPDPVLFDIDAAAEAGQVQIVGERASG